MCLCIGVTGENYSLVTSDMFSGATPERSAELDSRTASLSNGWLTFTSQAACMAQIAASTVEMRHPAYTPHSMLETIEQVYGPLETHLRPPTKRPNMEGHEFETCFFVAALGPRGYETYLLFSDGDNSLIPAGKAFVSPPPGMDDELDAARDDMAEYLATAPTVWEAMKRAGEVQVRMREGTGYVSRHMHALAVADPDGTGAGKLALFCDSDELAEMDPMEVSERTTRFEGCMSAEHLQERARQFRQRAAAGGA
jgi:hypothetical protein